MDGWRSSGEVAAAPPPSVQEEEEEEEEVFLAAPDLVKRAAAGRVCIWVRVWEGGAMAQPAPSPSTLSLQTSSPLRRVHPLSSLFWVGVPPASSPRPLP